MTETPDAMTDCSIRVPCRRCGRHSRPFCRTRNQPRWATGDRLQRVRLSADKSELFVVATSGATSALAAVPIEGRIRLSRRAVRAWDGRSRSTCRPVRCGASGRCSRAARRNADGEYDVVQLDMTPDAIMISDASACSWRSSARHCG